MRIRKRFEGIERISGGLMGLQGISVNKAVEDKYRGLKCREK